MQYTVPLVSCEPDYATLANDIINLYASIECASYRLLRLIQRFDEACLAETQGFMSTAQWLGFYLGLGSNAAREKVRVARALVGLPQIDAGYAEGKLSYSKVRALTRVATVDNESQLLDLARHATGHQVERIVRNQLRIHKGRQPVSIRPELIWYETDNGDLVFKARMSNEQGQLVVAAINQLLDGEPVLDPNRPDAEPLATRRAQALVEMAEISLEPRTEQPQSSADRYTVHVEHDDPGLSDAALERLTCDAAFVVHHSAVQGHNLNVGRKTRTIPPAIRRALRRRDKGCRFPGCAHARFVDAHHVHHWADGGETKLDNLILLCRRHHTFIHDKRAYIQVHKPERGTVRFRFLTPEGVEILPTGDGCVARAKVSELPLRKVASVSAVTSESASPLAPANPTARANHDEIAWILGYWDPPAG